MAGVLYIVATPIGNLSDISQRAVQILSTADVIAAEDTRHSRQLLNHLGISKKLVSYHEHNERSRSAELIEHLQQGQQVALVSDAGTPLISDPGYTLVIEARNNNISVVPVPGACSVITALSAAGLPTDSFYYAGFLSSKNKERMAQLQSLQAIPSTLVLLESTHRIVRLLQQLADVFADQTIVVAKELTKTHERFFSGTASDILGQLVADEKLQKGEFVVMIDNPPTQANIDYDNVDRLLTCLIKALPLKQAAAVAAEFTGLRKNDLYQRALSLKADS